MAALKLIRYTEKEVFSAFYCHPASSKNTRRKMKKYFALVLLIQLNTFAQNENFSVVVFDVKGDLNKDKLEDKVVVTQDTLNDNAPYRLQVFFAQPNGVHKLIAETTQLIEAQFPNGKKGYQEGNEFYELTIVKGVVTKKMQLLRGSYEHKFRFQNGAFELIGFKGGFSNGRGEMTSIDFNLSTGIRTEKTERYDAEKVISNTKKKILIRPLPKLQDVVPFENELY